MQKLIVPAVEDPEELELESESYNPELDLINRRFIQGQQLRLQWTFRALQCIEELVNIIHHQNFSRIWLIINYITGGMQPNTPSKIFILFDALDEAFNYISYHKIISSKITSVSIEIKRCLWDKFVGDNNPFDISKQVMITINADEIFDQQSSSEIVVDIEKQYKEDLDKLNKEYEDIKKKDIEDFRRELEVITMNSDIFKKLVKRLGL